MRDRTAGLQYFFHRSNPKPVGRVMKLNEFDLRGWNDDAYQICGTDFTKEFENGFVLRTEKIPDPVAFSKILDYPIVDLNEFNRKPYYIPEWVKQGRAAKFNTTIDNIVPYTHYAGGIITKQLVRPPFRIQVIQDCIYPDKTVPCVWCYNNVDYEPVTREFDITESQLGEGMYSSYNSSEGKAWAPPRSLNFSMLCWKPIGFHTFDLVVYPTSTRWYCDGKLYKTVNGEFDWNYFILCTLIVTQPNVPEVEWKIKSFSIDF